jgi:hypothetical protein
MRYIDLFLEGIKTNWGKAFSGMHFIIYKYCAVAVIRKKERN